MLHSEKKFRIRYGSDTKVAGVSSQPWNHCASIEPISSSAGSNESRALGFKTTGGGVRQPLT